VHKGKTLASLHLHMQKVILVKENFFKFQLVSGCFSLEKQVSAFTHSTLGLSLVWLTFIQICQENKGKL